MVFEILRFWGESVVLLLIMWVFVGLWNLFSIVIVNWFIFILFGLSIMINLFFIFLEMLLWWREQRVVSFMRCIGVVLNMMMSKVVYIVDFVDVLGVGGQEFLFLDNSICFVIYKGLMDVIDMDVLWEDVGVVFIFGFSCGFV